MTEQKKRQNMAPWWVLVASAVASFGALLVFDWADKTMHDWLRYGLLGAGGLSVFVFNGGDLSDASDWFKSRFGR